MGGIIERAEAALERVTNHPYRPFGAQPHSSMVVTWELAELVPELLADLKAARAEVERLQLLPGPPDASMPIRVRRLQRLLRRGLRGPGRHCGPREKAQCVCGEPKSAGVIHRTDGPCYYPHGGDGK